MQLDGNDARAVVDQIIAEPDAARRPGRSAAPRGASTSALPAALALCIGLAGCTLAADDQAPSKEDAARAKADGFFEELCEAIEALHGCDICSIMGWYDDGECDEFCNHDDPDCLVVLGGFPFEEDCRDGEDEDGDGTTDCCDEDCFDAAMCAALCSRDAAPLSEGACDDCVDDDCDGHVDCDDADCSGDPACGGAPPAVEDCGNGLDDDGDGHIDDDDDDCA